MRMKYFFLIVNIDVHYKIMKMFTVADNPFSQNSRLFLCCLHLHIRTCQHDSAVLFRQLIGHLSETG